MPPGGAIGDTGEKQHLIKTLPRKGFRFVGAVQEEDTAELGRADRFGDAWLAWLQRRYLQHLAFPSLCYRSLISAEIPSKTISSMA